MDSISDLDAPMKDNLYANCKFEIEVLQQELYELRVNLWKLYHSQVAQEDHLLALK